MSWGLHISGYRVKKLFSAVWVSGWMFSGGGGPILVDQTSVMCRTITAMSLIMAVALVWSVVILMVCVGRPINFFSCCQYLRGLLARSSASLLIVSIQWWCARILPSSRMSWTVFRLCLLSARWVLSSLVLLWWSVSLHRIDVSLLNLSETEIKGLVLPALDLLDWQSF